MYLKADELSSCLSVVASNQTISWKCLLYITVVITQQIPCRLYLVQNQLTSWVIRCRVYPVKGRVELCGAGWPHPLALTSIGFLGDEGGKRSGKPSSSARMRKTP